MRGFMGRGSMCGFIRGCMRDRGACMKGGGHV